MNQLAHGDKILDDINEILLPMVALGQVSGLYLENEYISGVSGRAG